MDKNEEKELKELREKENIKRGQFLRLMATPCGKCGNYNVYMTVKVHCGGPCGCTGKCKTVPYCYECAKEALKLLGHDTDQANMKGIYLL